MKNHAQASLLSLVLACHCTFNNQLLCMEEPSCKRTEIPVVSSEQLNKKLLIAAYNLDLETVRLLLKAGANVNAQDCQVTPLHCAVIYDDDNLNSVSNDNLGMVKLLLNNHAKINAHDGGGNTPLHTALDSGCPPEVIRFLLNNRAKVNAQNNKGDTPLHTALYDCCQPGVILLLLNAGANVRARNKQGATPLHYAASRGNPEVVQLLLDAHANVDARARMGYTPLHEAAENDNLNVVQILLKAGANVNAQDALGDTPLHGAAKKGHLDVVRSLVGLAHIPQDLGAIVVNAWANAPIEICQLMFSFISIDLDIRNIHGQTAFDVATTDEIKDLLRPIA
ncbi:MAG: ankyrin repeat domain-containing protein [Candidatus Babeliales bacterium]|jgi:ankyrin repeat protein